MAKSTKTKSLTARKGASERAAALLGEALVWDMLLPWMAGWGDDETLPRFKDAGVDFISLTVNDFPGSIAGSLHRLSEVRAYIREHSNQMVQVYSVADIRAAKKAGKLALAFHFQETNPLEGDINMVETYYDLGVRHMLMAYNTKNQVGDGCAEATDAGLSRYGVRVIEEMNRVGMLVDGAHCGYRTSMEAMEASTAPFVFSHCLAFGVYRHYRNIRDDQIKACAKTGGIIGLNGVGQFVEESGASPEGMFRHIDYMANLVGPEHLGLGIDYVKDTEEALVYLTANPDGWPLNQGKPHPVQTFIQPEQLVAVVDLLLEHQYSEADVRGILGENYARVAEQVWK